MVYFAVSARTDLQFATSPSTSSVPQYDPLNELITVGLTSDGNLGLCLFTTVPGQIGGAYGWTVLGNGDGTFRHYRIQRGR